MKNDFFYKDVQRHLMPRVNTPFHWRRDGIAPPIPPSTPLPPHYHWVLLMDIGVWMGCPDNMNVG